MTNINSCCSTSFRLRYNNHTLDSNLIHKRENTTLADHKWYLKERNINFTQSWRLEAFSRSYTPEAGYCDLCLTEKFMINKYHKERNLLNKRNEIFRKCLHRSKFLLSNFQAIFKENISSLFRKQFMTMTKIFGAFLTLCPDFKN